MTPLRSLCCNVFWTDLFYLFPALYRTALIVGLQGVRQPTGLHVSSGLFPDLLVILPGRRILTDVWPSATSRPRKSKEEDVSEETEDCEVDGKCEEEKVPED